MPASGDTPRGRRALGMGRMEAFSDGVFAFAATLLGADLAVHPPGTLRQVLNEWPGYLAFVVSFLTTGAAWLAHTALTDRLARADPVIMEINLLVLLAVAFLPFPTRLVADALHEAAAAERVGVTLYGLTLLTIRLLGTALNAYARHEHLYSPQGNGDKVEAPRRKSPARGDRVCDRDPDRACSAVASGGVVLRYRGIPDRAVPGSRTAAVPAFDADPANERCSSVGVHGRAEDDLQLVMATDRQPGREQQRLTMMRGLLPPVG